MIKNVAGLKKAPEFFFFFLNFSEFFFFCSFLFYFEQGVLEVEGRFLV